MRAVLLSARCLDKRLQLWTANLRTHAVLQPLVKYCSSLAQKTLAARERAKVKPCDLSHGLDNGLSLGSVPIRPRLPEGHRALKGGRFASFVLFDFCCEPHISREGHRNLQCLGLFSAHAAVKDLSAAKGLSCLQLTQPVRSSWGASFWFLRSSPLESWELRCELATCRHPKRQVHGAMDHFGLGFLPSSFACVAPAACSR